jgi:deoxycytidine triphosphate deaminase
VILGVDQLLSLVRSKKLVEGLSKRELTNPEGAGFDLRVGEIYRLGKKSGFLGVTDRKTADLKPLAKYFPKKTIQLDLEPHIYYVVKTIESINLPPDILALFRPRSTLYRSGLMLFTGNASPGYQGGLSFGLINFGQQKFVLEMGARIVHAMFYEVRGKTNLYRGQWQGGRVGTSKLEKQV